MNLTIQCLGDFSVQLDLKPITVPKGQQRALLMYLAAKSGSWCDRQQIINLLLPNRPEKQMKNMTKLLQRLRKTIAGSHLNANFIETVSNGAQIRLNPDNVSCDVAMFTRTAQARNALSDAYLWHAIDLYKGLFAPNGAEFRKADKANGTFGAWLVEKQTVLDAEMHELISLLAKRLIINQAWDDLHKLALRWQQYDPTSGYGTELLLAANAMQGDLLATERYCKQHLLPAHNDSAKVSQTIEAHLRAQSGLIITNRSRTTVSIKSSQVALNTQLVSDEMPNILLLFGYDSELSILLSFMREPTSKNYLLLSGITGVGRKHLAYHALRILKEHIPVIICRFQIRSSAFDLLSAWQDKYHQATTVGQLARRIAKEPICLLLEIEDDVVLNPDCAIVRLLSLTNARSDSGRVLVVGQQHHLLASNQEHIQLSGVDNDAAINLFFSEIGVDRKTYSFAELDDVAFICQVLGYHPALLKQFSQLVRLGESSIEILRDEVRELFTLYRSNTGDWKPTIVDRLAKDMVSGTLYHISNQAWALLIRMARFPDQITFGMVADLAGIEPAISAEFSKTLRTRQQTKLLRPILLELVKNQWITVSGSESNRSYCVHPLVRHYALWSTYNQGLESSVPIQAVDNIVFQTLLAPNWANALSMLGAQQDRSQQVFALFLTRYAETGDSSWLKNITGACLQKARTDYVLALIYQDVGETERAIDYCDKALSKLSKLPESTSKHGLLLRILAVSIATNCRNQQFQDALNDIQQAEKLLVMLDSVAEFTWEIGQLYLAEALYWHSQNDLMQARCCAEQAAECFTQNGAQLQHIKALSMLTVFDAMATGGAAMADVHLDLIERLEALPSSFEVKGKISAEVSNLTKTLFDTGRIDDAYAWCVSDKGLAFIQAHANPRHRMAASINFAAVLNKRGEFAGASNQLIEASYLANLLGYKSRYWAELMTNFAECSAGLKQNQQALNQINEARTAPGSRPFLDRLTRLESQILSS